MNDRFIFCAHCQEDCPHIFSRNYDGDFIFQCGVCKRELKFDRRFTSEQLDQLVAIHRAENQGQIYVAPGAVGVPDVHVEPGNHPTTPEQIAHEDIIDAQNQLQGTALAQDPELGPRAQEDLTDAEKAIWAGIKNNVQ